MKYFKIYQTKWAILLAKWHQLIWSTQVATDLQFAKSTLSVKPIHKKGEARYASIRVELRSCKIDHCAYRTYPRYLLCGSLQKVCQFLIKIAIMHFFILPKRSLRFYVQGSELFPPFVFFMFLLYFVYSFINLYFCLVLCNTHP